MLGACHELPPTETIGHPLILATTYVSLVRGTEGIPPQTAAAIPGVSIHHSATRGHRTRAGVVPASHWVVISFNDRTF